MDRRSWSLLFALAAPVVVYLLVPDSAGSGESIVQLGHAEHQPHYVAHCPMAFDFQGADWLQRGRTINNPYFGAEMLRCGQVTDEVSGQEGGAR
jgi:hypothetical protein